MFKPSHIEAKTDDNEIQLPVEKNTLESPERRDFFKKFAAVSTIAAGAALGLLPNDAEAAEQKEWMWSKITKATNIDETIDSTGKMQAVSFSFNPEEIKKLRESGDLAHPDFAKGLAQFLWNTSVNRYKKYNPSPIDLKWGELNRDIAEKVLPIKKNLLKELEKLSKTESYQEKKNPYYYLCSSIELSQVHSLAIQGEFADKKGLDAATQWRKVMEQCKTTLDAINKGEIYASNFVIGNLILLDGVVGGGVARINESAPYFTKYLLAMDKNLRAKVDLKNDSVATAQEKIEAAVYYEMGRRLGNTYLSKTSVDFFNYAVETEKKMRAANKGVLTDAQLCVAEGAGVCLKSDKEMKLTWYDPIFKSSEVQTIKIDGEKFDLLTMNVTHNLRDGKNQGIGSPFAVLERNLDGCIKYKTQDVFAYNDKGESKRVWA